MNIFLALLASALTLADFSPTAAGDWFFREEVDNATQKVSCVSFTLKSDQPEFVQLAVHYSKDGSFVPQLRVKTKSYYPSVALKISDTEWGTFLPFASDETSTTYWYVPQQFTKTVEFLRQKSVVSLVLDPKGSALMATTSLKGSAATIDQAKTCAKAAPDFGPFFTLLNQTKENLHPDLGDRSVGFLMQSVEAAYVAYKNGVSLQKALADARKGAAPLLKKEETALANFQKTLAALEKAESALRQTEDKFRALEEKRILLASEIEQNQRELSAGEAALAEKSRVYLPLKEQLAPYDQLVQESEREVASLRASIQQKEGVISKNQKSIARMQAEMADIQREIPSLQNEVNRLEIQLQSAESDLRAYDPFREKQRILDRDFQYRSLKMDFDNKQRDLQRIEWDLRRAERDLDRAQDNLRRCRARPENLCLIEQNEVNRAANERDRHRREVNRLERDLQWIRTQMDWRETSADREARQEYDRLRSRRDSIASQTLQARNELSNKRNRLSEIQATLPRLEQEMWEAERVLPDLRAQLQTAEAKRLNHVERRNAFANQIGFPQAEREYFDAKNFVAAKQERSKELSAQMTQVQKDLTQVQKEVQARLQERNKAQNEHQVNVTKLAQVREELKVFRMKEEELLGKISEEKGSFQFQQAVYQDLSRYWMDRF